MPTPCCPPGSRGQRSLFLLLVAVCVAIPILAVIRLSLSDDREVDHHRSLAVAAHAPAAAPAKRPHADPAGRPGPRAEYQPDQVVQIVMDALQNNDESDSGIVTAFNFASPGNKRFTGPIERFIPMVKTVAYRPMLNFRSAAYGELKLSDDRTAAEQEVSLLSADGEGAVYVFHLSKQSAGEFKGCWMTDGVMRVKPKGPQA